MLNLFFQGSNYSHFFYIFKDFATQTNSDIGDEMYVFTNFNSKRNTSTHPNQLKKKYASETKQA